MVMKFKNLLLEIGKNPRAGFSYLVESGYNKHVFLILILMGISVMFSNAMTRNIGDTFGPFGYKIYIIILGPIFGIVWAYLLSWLISVTGKWMKGHAKTKDIVSVFSIACIPNCLMLIIHLLFLIIFGTSIFHKSFNVLNYSTISIIIYYVSISLTLITLTLYIYLFVIGISVLQGFSVIKSILNIFFAAFLFVLPIMILTTIMAILTSRG